MNELTLETKDLNQQAKAVSMCDIMDKAVNKGIKKSIK